MTRPPDGVSTSTLLDLLADEQRRAIVRRLDGETTAVPIETLHDAWEPGTSPDEWVARAHHVHLPKLDEASVVEYDAHEKTVRRGHQFEPVVSLLFAISEHRSNGSAGVDVPFGSGHVDE